ncbi:hypothetical protein EJ03DRAFT_339605 [Teratosphaeria nubilosa]|uniref:Sin3 binding protein n=1 Tax=Teratosphaeria nubilosa TaxID=161662 RepID=A0A6G1KXF3_9PEZI|nr:hypothetical protein EJ03DRAFT_339605 [Teratosphaeria nubilosa]
MALASPANTLNDTAKPRDATAGLPARGKQAGALPTPPNSVSPNLPAFGTYTVGQDSPLMDIEHESGLEGIEELPDMEEEDGDHTVPAGMPLSRGALSGLDASAAITPSMLAKHHLPGIMLGNGPRPIRYVMGELTQSVPGFSRIPPAKARRLVVAALESRQGGGPDGNVAFCKTGWGRWDAHIKGSSRDSAIGSFNDGNLSPPRSEHSGYAMSYGDSGVHMAGLRAPSGYREHHSGGSWTASSLREEDEDIDMDALEHEADKMSLDGASTDDDTSDTDDATDEEERPTRYTPRKASVPNPGMPRKDYNAISIAYARRFSKSSSKTRRPSTLSIFHSSSLPAGFASRTMQRRVSATPDEQAAAAALLQMGSM